MLFRAPHSMASIFPFFAQGKVVRGFGRGSKELGIPTANFPDSVVESLPKSIETGIYYGWAKVDNAPVYKMVMSIGWNPFYMNEKRSMETHILHKFDHDFYGCAMKVCVCGYLRPEKSFDSLDELIGAIKQDIAQTEEKLERSPDNQYRDSTFFLAAHL